MAPTVIHISDQAKVGEYCKTAGYDRTVASFILDKNLDPPKNIAGKQCLVETTYFNYESTKPLSQANAYGQSAYFGWNMNSLWSPSPPGSCPRGRS